MVTNQISNKKSFKFIVRTSQRTMDIRKFFSKPLDEVTPAKPSNETNESTEQVVTDPVVVESDEFLIYATSVLDEHKSINMKSNCCLYEEFDARINEIPCTVSYQIKSCHSQMLITIESVISTRIDGYNSDDDESQIESETMTLYENVHPLMGFDETPQKLAAVYRSIHQLLDGLVFCKKSGQLLKSETMKKIEARGRAFSKFIREDLDNCAVCQEPTSTETYCEHKLCIQCWSSLVKLQCPLCRERL